MQALLDGLLPRLFPGMPFLCVPHDGKTDLERSIPRKLRGWREPGVRFAVVRDNDGKDCRTVKNALRERCRVAGRSDTLVRIACQELEAWYLGEPDALADAFGRASLRNSRGRSDSVTPTPSRDRTKPWKNSCLSFRRCPVRGAWHSTSAAKETRRPASGCSWLAWRQ